MTGETQRPLAAWWVLVGFDQQGPWELDQVRAAVAAGQVGPTSLVWAPGMTEWAPASTTALAAVFTPPPPPTVTPPPVPRSRLGDASSAPATAPPVDEAEATVVRAEPVAAGVPSASTEATGLCPYCHTGLAGAGQVVCPGCKAPHHDDCWAELRGCAVVGCSEAPQDAPPTPAAWASPAPAPAAVAPSGNASPANLDFFTARSATPGWAAPNPGTAARPAGAVPRWAPPDPETRR